MRKSLLLAAVIGTFAATNVAFAEEAAPAAAPESPHSFSYNIGLYSQYIFRGLAQTGEEPALQGGVDYAHSSGFYVGAWASNISWLEDDGLYENSSLELDIYAGYAAEIGDTGIGYDIGLLQYIYPGSRNSGTGTKSAETTELYAALSYGWVTGKISYGLTDIFGFKNTDGSVYYELNADIPLPWYGLMLGGHVGHQAFAGSGNGSLDYTDYKISLSKAWDNGVELGAFYSATDASKGDSSAAGYVDGSGTYLGKDTFVAYVSKSF
jgi:uncharacterized protein (TIGR02001 family)